ncbi:ribosomal RNA small subunit methyltransferase-like [Macadamia integrifolia]|uniref:ribosomal RNA small subunit methyltransferase-like n=1 Tax=Macadamia integrifolia TaxID=60698 RepID=UPI001C4E64E6|nr:ribosomal RNA small subunit methyltransferase-like [Macadamia integrifolia]
MAGGKMRKEKPSRAATNYHLQGGIPFHKSKGQHILKNPLLVDTIVQKAGNKSTYIILEIGPGTGNLTKKLLDAGKSVIAVELDPRMVLELQRRFQGPYSNRLKVIQGDVLKCDLPYFDICVALQLSQKGSSEDTDIAKDVSVLVDANEDMNMEMEDGKEDEDLEMEDGDAGMEGSDFKDKVLGILKQGGFEEKRSSKLTQVDFLYLLSLFKKAGIHFS